MDQIESLLREFAAKIQAVANREAAASVAAQMEAVSAQFAKAGAVLGSFGKSKSKGKKTSKAAPKATPGKRIRRSPEQLEQQAKKILSLIKKAPGQKIDAISAAVDMSVAELQTPIAQLKAFKSIVTRGTKRSTAYFPKG